MDLTHLPNREDLADALRLLGYGGPGDADIPQLLGRLHAIIEIAEPTLLRDGEQEAMCAAYQETLFSIAAHDRPYHQRWRMYLAALVGPADRLKYLHAMRNPGAFPKLDAELGMACELTARMLTRLSALRLAPTDERVDEREITDALEKVFEGARQIAARLALLTNNLR